MGIVSGGSGGGGPAAGTYIPTADAVAFTVDNTTYNNPISGSGKLTTLIFTGNKAALAIAKSGDAFPRWLMSADGADGIYMGNGSFDPYVGGPFILGASSGNLQLQAKAGQNIVADNEIVTQAAATSFTSVPQIGQLSPLFSITSGALPTVTITSGTGRQISTSRDVETVTPFTGDATNNAATCKCELSPDNVTYSTLNTESIAAALNLTGALDISVNVRVPAGWYIKLTAVHGTLGTTTYY